MAMLKVSALGPLQISLEGKQFIKFESNKARALLVYLIIENQQPHSREIITELLWPDHPSKSALGNLRYALTDLRRAIADNSTQPAYLTISRERLQFNIASEHELDITAFNALSRSDDISDQKQALALYRDDFLKGFPSIRSNPFEDWITLERERYKRQAIDIFQKVISYFEKSNQFELALPYAYQRIELAPWLEEAHQQLMRLLALCGQRSTALAQFNLCQAKLANELNVAPSKETLRLYEAIRDGGLGAPRMVATSQFARVRNFLNNTHQSVDDNGDATIRMIAGILADGQSAANRSAYDEAVTFFRHGLELLNALPDSSKKSSYELKIQIALGAALLPIRNFSSGEVAQVYRRIYGICQGTEDRSELFHALKALSSYYALCGDIFSGLDISGRLMEIAEETQDESQLIIAHNNRGITLLFSGDARAFQRHMLKLLEHYDNDRHRHLASIMGYDPKVATLSNAIGLWAIGYPDQALDRVLEAVQWAENLQHPFSQCYARFFLANIHLLRREIPDAFEQANILIQMAKQQCNSFWFGQGLIIKGWATAQYGKHTEGLQLLMQGFSIISGTGSRFVLCTSAAWLCEVCGLVGNFQEGLSILDDYIVQSENAGIFHMMSPNYLCQGDLLLKLNRVEEAKLAYDQAIRIACDQQARGWELRARVAMARLYLQQHRTKPIYPQLREITSWFSEGLDLPDIREATMLIEKMELA